MQTLGSNQWEYKINPKTNGEEIKPCACNKSIFIVLLLLLTYYYYLSASTTCQSLSVIMYGGFSAFNTKRK